jgi:hypothetical protein
MQYIDIFSRFALDSLLSDNLYAETWLQALAAQPSGRTASTTAPQQTAVPTRDAAINAVRSLLFEMGVDGGLFHQKDGRFIPLVVGTANCASLIHFCLAACLGGILFLLLLLQARPHRRQLCCLL